MRTGNRFALIVSALALIGSSLTLSESFALSASGPQLVKDIVPGSDGSIPWWITPASGSVYFSADDPEHGRELWTSDGTTAGTVLVKDIRPGSHGSRPELFTEVGGVVYFRAENRLGAELWRTDGTRSGTSLVKDVAPGSSGAVEELTHVGDTLFFTEWGKHGFLELWKSDGTSAGTVLVKPCHRRAEWCGAGIWDLTVLGENLFFVAPEQHLHRSSSSLEVRRHECGNGLGRKLRQLQLGSVRVFPAAPIPDRGRRHSVLHRLRRGARPGAVEERRYRGRHLAGQRHLSGGNVVIRVLPRRRRRDADVRSL